MDTAQYYLFLIFKKVIEITPKKLESKIISLFLWLIYNRKFARKKVVLKNLEIAFPGLSKEERENLAKDVYRKYLRYFADIIRSVNISKDSLKRKVTIRGEEYLNQALQSNKPIIFMTAHFGNWEVAPKVIGAFYKPMVVLMREFDNPKIGEFFKKSRASFNIEPINKEGSIKEVIKAFKEGKALGILIDQHTIAQNAVDVNFLNKRVKFNRAISTLAEKFDAIAVPMFSYEDENGYILEFLEPKTFEDCTIESFTQWQATTIEKMIKKHPSEYYWFHKRFKNIEGTYK